MLQGWHFKNSSLVPSHPQFLVIISCWYWLVHVVPGRAQKTLTKTTTVHSNKQGTVVRHVLRVVHPCNIASAEPFTWYAHVVSFTTLSHSLQQCIHSDYGLWKLITKMDKSKDLTDWTFFWDNMQPVPLPLIQNCLFTEGGGEDGLETEKKGCYDPSLHLSRFQHKSIDLLKRKITKW